MRAPASRAFQTICLPHFEQENGNLIISFSDEGTGMSPAVLEQLFEPFFSTKHTGTGLGLAVSQEIVTAHEGQITATSPIHESAVRPGSRITITLPLYAEAGVEGETHVESSR